MAVFRITTVMICNEIRAKVDEALGEVDLTMKDLLNGLLLYASKKTPKEMLDTMRINLQIKPDSLFTYTFYPFPGTDLMNTSLKNNYIDSATYEKLMDGFGDYQSRSLLRLPYNSIAYNMKVILALLNKIPRFLHDYFLNTWVAKNHSDILLSLIKVLSIPFYSSWEAKGRFKEQVSMFKTYYLKKLKKELNL